MHEAQREFGVGCGTSSCSSAAVCCYVAHMHAAVRSVVGGPAVERAPSPLVTLLCAMPLVPRPMAAASGVRLQQPPRPAEQSWRCSFHQVHQAAGVPQVTR